MIDTTVHTPKTFSLEIEKLAFEKRCTHLEAISIYCEKVGIEPVTTAKLLTTAAYEDNSFQQNSEDVSKDTTDIIL